MNSAAGEKTLLVVDDESTVCRALSRMLGDQVARVLTASSPAEAETVLESQEVTHLICDHWFGPGEPVGLEVASKWKQQYGSLVKVVVLTGTDVTRLDAAQGVDCIMDKTASPEEIARALGF